MTKIELINHLQSINGNPEVMIWNGLVNDYVPLHSDIFTNNLYRKSVRMFFVEARMKRGKPYSHKFTLSELWEMRAEAKQSHKLASHEPYVPSLPDEKLSDYHNPNPKQIIVLQQGKVNKTYQDRLGSIEY